MLIFKVVLNFGGDTLLTGTFKMNNNNLTFEAHGMLIRNLNNFSIQIRNWKGGAWID